MRLSVMPFQRFRTAVVSILASNALVLSVAAVSFSAVPVSADDESVRPVREQFVPADQLDTILRRTPSGVLLPKEEFQELLAKAKAATSERHPGDATIVSATYKLSTAEDHALIDLTVRVRQFRPGWATVEIPIGNLLPESATIDNQPATVGTKPGTPGTLLILNDSVGTFDCRLVLSTGLIRSGADRSVVFKTFKNVPATLIADCPAGEQMIMNGRRLRRPDVVAKATEYSIPIGNSNDLRLTWTTRRQQQLTDNLVFATSTILARMNPVGMQWNSETRLSVFGEKLDRLSASVPATLEITDVQSEGLEQWTLEDAPAAEDQIRLLLKYRQPFDQDRLVTIKAVSTVASDQTKSRIPTLNWNQLTAHTGQVAVHSEASQRLQTEPVSGLNRIASGQKQSRRHPEDADVFDFWKQNFELDVGIRSKDREVFAQVESEFQVSDSLVTFTARIKLEALNEPLFDATFNLPTGWRVQSIADDSGKRIPWSLTDEGTSILVELPKPVEAGHLGTFVFRANRNIDDPEISQIVALPVIQVEDAVLAGGTYTMSSAGDLKLSFPELSGLVPYISSNNRIVFEAQTSQYSGTVQVDRKVARLATRTELRTWTDPDTVSTSIDLTVDVVHGSTRSLTVQLPESLTADVRFVLRGIGQVPGQKQHNVPSSISIIEQTPLPIIDGMRPFKLTFDKRFVGSINLVAMVETDRNDDFTWTAPFARIAEANRQQGLVVFEARPVQQLEVADGSISGLTRGDASLVPACQPSTDRRVAMVFRFVSADYSATVNETTFETVAVPSAVCQQIENVVVIDQQQSVQRSARMTFQTSGVQTLRFRLPNHSYLWSTVLNGKAVQVRRNKSDYLVALPTESRSSDDQVQTLEILFESHNGQEAENQQPLDDSLQESVSLMIDTNTGTSRPIDVLEQTWKLRYPESVALTDIPDRFQLEKGQQSRGWIQSMVEQARRYQLPSSRQLTARSVPTIIALLALFVVTVLISKRRWKVLLGVSFVGLLLFSLILSQPFRGSSSRLDKVANTEITPSAERAIVMDGTVLADGDVSVTSQFDESKALGVGGGFGGGSSGGLGGGGFGGFGGGGGRAGTAANDEIRVPAGLGEASNDAAPQSGESHDLFFSGAAPTEKESLEGQITLNANGMAPFQQQFNDDFMSRSLQEQRQLGRQAGQAGDDPFVAPTQNAAPTVRFGRLALGKNAARLSVKADVANPDNFRFAIFRSINSGTSDQSFPITLQSAQVRSALRLVTAAIAVLLCLMCGQSAVTFRIIFGCFLLLASAALVPLLPIRWQPIADGLFAGTSIGVILWILIGIIRMATRCCVPKPPKTRRTAATGAATVALILLHSMTSANCQLAIPNQQAETSQRQSSEATERPATESPAADSNALRPDIVLPYRPGEPELLANQVFLPREQFLKLFRLANPDQLPDGQQAKASFVVAAYYQAEKMERGASDHWVQNVTARYVVRSFSDHPTLVSLPIKNVSLQSVTLKDDQPAVVKPTTDHSFRIQLPTAGLHVVDAVFKVSAKREGKTGQFELNLQPVPSGTVIWQLPEDGLAATVNDSERSLRQNGRQVIVPIAAGGKFRFQWTEKGNSESRNTFFHVDAKSAFRIDDQGLSTVSDLHLSVRQGSISQFTVQVSLDDNIRMVQGTNVAGWQTQTNDGINELTISFQQPVTDQAVVTLNLFRKMEIDSTATKLQLSIPVVPKATRDAGTIAVLSENGFDVRVSSLSSVSQTDVKSVALPNRMTSGTMRTAAAFRYTRQPAVVELKIGRNEVRRSIEIVNAVQLDQQRQRWTTLFKTTTTGTAIRQLQIALPDDFLVLDVQANSMADRYVVEPSEETADFKILTIQLQEARYGTVNAVIQGQMARSGNGGSEVLSGPGLPKGRFSSQDRFQGQLHVWLDATSEISTIQANNWQRIPAGTSAQAEVRKLAPKTPAVSFRTTNPKAAEVQLHLRKAVPSLLAESVLVTNVTETSLELSLALNWQIARAAGSDFSFSIPTDLVDVFDFQIPGLRQLDQQQEGESTKFTIRLQQPVAAKLFVMGTATLPLPEANRIRPFDVRFAVADSSEAIIASQTHYWVLVNQSAGLLQLADNDSKPREVKATELKTSVPKGFLEQSVSIQRCKPNGATPAWELTFPEPEQVTPAVISLAEHRLIIAEDGSWKSHHTLQVRNESRQFLPIQLPKNASFLSCLVKNRPTRIVIQPSETGSRSLIPIPQSGRLSTVFKVEFLLAGQLELKPTNLSGQPLELPLPVFPEFRDDSEYGITVARNTVRIWTPKSWHAATIDDPRLTNVVPAAQNDLEDARLLSAVDNLRTLIDSTKANQSATIDQNLNDQLFDQRLILENITGNSADAIGQRSELIREFDDLGVTNQIMSQLNEAQLNEALSREAQSDFPSLMQHAADGFGNSILVEKDLNQNHYLQSNNEAFFLSNGGLGLGLQKNLKDPVFNFALPELAVDKPTAPADLKALRRMAGPQKRKPDGQIGVAGKLAPSWSQLMLNRSDASKANQAGSEQFDPVGSPFGADNAKTSGGRETERNSLSGADRSRLGDQMGLRGQTAAPNDLSMPVPNRATGGEFDFSFEPEQQLAVPAVQPKGLLSLNFDLPESGVPSDYIRTGGNPRLTLKVRSTKQVEESYGWIWAIVCVFLFFGVRRSVMKSPERIAIRLLWIGLMLALAGWVFLPETTGLACLITLVVLSLVMSATTISRSFRKPKAA